MFDHMALPGNMVSPREDGYNGTCPDRMTTIPRPKMRIKTIRVSIIFFSGFLAEPAPSLITDHR